MEKLIFVSAMLLTIATFAEDDKEIEHYKNAVKQTQELLQNKSQRDAAIQQSPEAKKAAEKVKALAGDAVTEEEYYKLASEIFGNYQNEEAMKKSISEGMRNPAEFLNSLTPEQRAKIQELSRKLNPGAGLKNP